jgi:hypothetical protein
MPIYDPATKEWHFEKSADIPTIDYSPPIGDLFANLAFNWQSLKIPMLLLLGIFFAFFLANKIKKHYRGDDD